MKFHYYPETDSFYIDLSEKVSADSKEAAPGVVLDFDAEGHLVALILTMPARSLTYLVWRLSHYPSPAFR